MTTSVGPTEHSDSRLVSSGLSARLSHLVSSRALCVCVSSDGADRGEGGDGGDGGGSGLDLRGPEESDELDYLPAKHN